MNREISFIVRWLSCSFGLWIAVRLFGSESVTTAWNTIATFLAAGLIFSMINMVLKPLVTLLSLPFVVISLGLFTLIINGFLVWLAIMIAPNLSMGFWGAIIGGLILSMINFLISGIAELSRKEEKRGHR